MIFQVALPENDEGSKWKKKTDIRRFMVARDGDMLCAPFQCDHCWFINLKREEPVEESYEHQRLLGYIRRVNLDLLWSRERATVANTLGSVRKGMKMSEELGLKPQDIRLGPWPVGDNQGFQTAIEMLRASQKEGRNDKTYVQFDTVRKIRSGYSTIHENSANGGAALPCFKGDHGNTFIMNNGSTDTRLFRKFMLGLERRMGRLVKQNMGISVEVLVAMLDNYEIELCDRRTTNERKRMIIMCASAYVILFTGALRGGEVFLTEGSELVRRMSEGKSHPKHPHVVVPLMGRFKGENGERNLMLCLAKVTKSGINVRRWVERLGNLLTTERRNKSSGPAFCDKEGTVLERWRVNAELYKALTKVQAERPDLISSDINVDETYSIHRSFRRGATTRAREAKVPKDVIELNNRWSKVQRNSGGMPRLPMTELYTEIKQALASFLRFSGAL